MDPAGIALGVGAILGLTKVTEELACVAWQVFRDKEGEILLDVRDSARRLETTKGVIDLAVRAIEKGIKEYPDSPVVKELVGHGLFKGIRKDAKCLKRRIKFLLKEINRIKWWKRAQWLWSIKAKVDGLLPFLSSIGSLIHLAISSIMLWAGLTLPKSNDAATIKYISNTIEQRKLEAAHQSAELKSQWSLDVVGHESSSQEPRLQRKFEDLISHMCAFVDELRETEKVPRSSSSAGSLRSRRSSTSPGPSTSLTASTSQGSQEGDNKSEAGVETAYSVEPASPNRHRGFSSTASLSSAGEMHLVELYVTERPFDPSLESDPEVSFRTSHLDSDLPSSQTSANSSSISPTSSTISRQRISQQWASLNKPLPLAVDKNRKTRPLEVEKTGNVSGNSAPREIAFSPYTQRPILEGIIQSSHTQKSVGPTTKPTRARVDESMAENIISRSAALDLGLLIEEKDGLGRVVFGDRSFANVIGTVVAYWWPSGDLSRKRRKIKVLFWVCEYLQENIVFGRLFQESREQRRTSEP